MEKHAFETMLTRASWLIAGGLAVQLVTSFWVDAMSFILFLATGGGLTAAGVLLFLRWLAMSRGAHTSAE